MYRLTRKLSDSALPIARTIIQGPRSFRAIEEFPEPIKTSVSAQIQKATLWHAVSCQQFIDKTKIFDRMRDGQPAYTSILENLDPVALVDNTVVCGASDLLLAALFGAGLLTTATAEKKQPKENTENKEHSVIAVSPVAGVNKTSTVSTVEALITNTPKAISNDHAIIHDMHESSSLMGGISYSPVDYLENGLLMG